MSNKRTQKDEDEYNAILRREDSIKTEIIVQLREQNKTLWTSQATLLEAVIRAEDALRIYREQALAIAQQAANSSSRCTPGCTRHRWDDKDGWHREDE